MRDPNDDGKRRKLAEMINDIEVAVMTTVSGEGELHGRPMATAEFREPYHELWFATDRGSVKVDELQRDPRVGLTYAEPKDYRFVCIAGQASLSDHRGKIHELWSPQWKAWFTGPDDPRLVLIRVEPSRAEYWDSGSNKLVVLFQMAKAAVTGRRKDLGENERVAL